MVYPVSIFSLLLPKTIYNGRACLRFYYHMYGNDMGTLRVYIMNKQGGKDSVWSRSGNMLNKWHNTSEDINLSAGSQVKHRNNSLWLSSLS